MTIRPERRCTPALEMIMSNAGAPGLDIVPVWARFNADLIRLVEYVPEDQIDWSPKPELWNFRGIMLHIANARGNWLEHTVKDGGEAPNTRNAGA